MHEGPNLLTCHSPLPAACKNNNCSGAWLGSRLDDGGLGGDKNENVCPEHVGLAKPMKQCSSSLQWWILKCLAHHKLCRAYLLIAQAKDPWLHLESNGCLKSLNSTFTS